MQIRGKILILFLQVAHPHPSLLNLMERGLWSLLVSVPLLVTSSSLPCAESCWLREINSLRLEWPSDSFSHTAILKCEQAATLASAQWPPVKFLWWILMLVLLLILC